MVSLLQNYKHSKMSDETEEQRRNPSTEEQQNGSEAEEGEVKEETGAERGAKRTRTEAFNEEEEEGGVQSPKRTARSQHDVLFRIIVPSKEIGVVIGKEGSRIRKIREDTKANIKIADAIARHEERVIIISSSDTDNEISEAERALLHIARVVLKEDENHDVERLNLSMQHVATNMIRLLIAGSQAGGLIGKSGQNIAKIRNLSGATVTVLAKNQLPLCASAHESDRVVQISGNVPEVLKALEQIGRQLREIPPRKVVSVQPAYGVSSNGATQTSLPQNTADCVTSEIMIAEALVGGLIGRCGSNISQIRNMSGATIKVSGGKGEKDHRQIHFQGSPHQVALARKLVDDYIYSQLLQ